jgi:hypothetical protein
MDKDRDAEKGDVTIVAECPRWGTAEDFLADLILISAGDDEAVCLAIAHTTYWREPDGRAQLLTDTIRAMAGKLRAR